MFKSHKKFSWAAANWKSGKPLCEEWYLQSNGFNKHVCVTLYCSCQKCKSLFVCQNHSVLLCNSNKN